jgi:hypothetical protein
MEPKYLELLHSYIDSGYSTNQAAEKLYYDGEYEGSLNDLYGEANAYHDLKKKENRWSGAYIRIGRYKLGCFLSTEDS